MGPEHRLRIIETMPANYWETFLNERRIPAARIRRGLGLSDDEIEALCAAGIASQAAVAGDLMSVRA